MWLCRQNSLIKKRKGFTLVELLVAMGIFSILITGLYAVLLCGEHSFRYGSTAVSLQENARSIYFWLTRDLRRARTPVNATLDNNGESFSIITPSGSISYSLESKGNTLVLRRTCSGQTLYVGKDISSINISTSGDLAQVTVNVNKRVSYGDIQTFSVTGRVELRNL